MSARNPRATLKRSRAPVDALCVTQTTDPALAPAGGLSAVPSATPGTPAAPATPAAVPAPAAPRAAVSVIPFLRALVDVRRFRPALQGRVGPRVRIDGRLRKLQVPTCVLTTPSTWCARCSATTSSSSSPRTNEADFAYAHRGRRSLPCQRLPLSAVAPVWSSAASASARSRSTTSACRDVIAPLSMEPRGLVLVTGPTGSGKTTTLAGMIDHINANRDVHIVTIEDPIEVLHHDQLVDGEPARGPRRHRGLLRRAPCRDAAGPRRHPRRRDARPRDGEGRAVRRRDRPLRHVDAAHDGRAGDHHPRHRLLPSARAEADPASRSPALCAASSVSAWYRVRTGRAAAWPSRCASTPAGSPTPSRTRTRPRPSTS